MATLEETFEKYQQLKYSQDILSELLNDKVTIHGVSYSRAGHTTILHELLPTEINDKIRTLIEEELTRVYEELTKLKNIEIPF